jgi:hypothetical protein
VGEKGVGFVSRVKLSLIGLGVSVVMCAVLAAGAAAAVSRYNVHVTQPTSAVLTCPQEQVQLSGNVKTVAHGVNNGTIHSLHLVSVSAGLTGTGVSSGAAYRVGGANMASGVGFVDGVDESKLTIVYGFTLVAPGQPVLHVTGQSVLHVTEDPYTGELIAFVNDDRFTCF